MAGWLMFWMRAATEREPVSTTRTKACVVLAALDIGLDIRGWYQEHVKRMAAERGKGLKPAGQDDDLLVLASSAERVEHQVDAVVVAIDESIIEDDRHSLEIPVALGYASSVPLFPISKDGPITLR
jgi:hypothetical protein